MSFRAMQNSDLDAVYAIEQSAYEFPWARNIFEQTIKSNKYAVVMESNQRIVGYGVVSYVVGEAELLNLCIDPVQQGKGQGVALLEHLVDNATESGNKDMYLEVRESNASALHIYEKSGFNEIGRRKNYYPAKTGREDAVLMALPLAF
jgi:ribosomal-protein-alanine N-acetyltransferase